jgi:ParB family chromosome partitioning protein
LGIVDPEKQYTIAQQIFDEKLSVRETEKLVKKLQNEKEEIQKKPIDDTMSAIYQDLEQKLKGIMGTKVSIHQKDQNKGKIEIEYYNKDELDRIMELFASIHEI